jgi:hypothetical protein
MKVGPLNGFLTSSPWRMLQITWRGSVGTSYSQRLSSKPKTSTFLRSLLSTAQHRKILSGVAAAWLTEIERLQASATIATNWIPTDSVVPRRASSEVVASWFNRPCATPGQPPRTPALFWISWSVFLEAALPDPSGSERGTGDYNRAEPRFWPQRLNILLPHSCAIAI